MPERGPGKWPSDDAIRLWQEFREDPHGWHWTDLVKLLDRWGVTERLPGEDRDGYHSRVYRTQDGQPVYFWFKMYDECPAQVIVAICDQLERLWNPRRTP